MNAPIEEGVEYFEEAIRLTENTDKSKVGNLRLFILFAGRMFSAEFFPECRQILDRAQRLFEEALAVNRDSASRQELTSTAVDLLDIRTELAAREGEWSEVMYFAERFKARNLSRWMRIAALYNDPSLSAGDDLYLRRAILGLRAAEVEAEVRHVTRDTDGRSLHQLEGAFKYNAGVIKSEQERLGLSSLELDQALCTPDQILENINQVLAPGVGVLSFVSCRNRSVWTLLSKNKTTDQLMLGGARPIDHVDPVSGIPLLFRNWPYEKREAVSELIQSQIANADRDMRPPGPAPSAIRRRFGMKSWI